MKYRISVSGVDTRVYLFDSLPRNPYEWWGSRVVVRETIEESVAGVVDSSGNRTMLIFQLDKPTAFEGIRPLITHWGIWEDRATVVP